MSATSTSILFGVIGIYLLGPSAWVMGQDEQTDGPTGLEGSWHFVKSKDGDEEWIDRTQGVLRVKHITRTHFTYLEINPESKKVVGGSGGHCTIKGDSFKEKYTHYVTDDYKRAVGEAFHYTWYFKGEDLHLSLLKDGKQVHFQVWRRLAR